MTTTDTFSVVIPAADVLGPPQSQWTYINELLLLNGDAYRSRGAFRGKALLPSQVVSELPVQVEQFFA